MTQQELYKALEATCLFGPAIKIGIASLQCGVFRFEHINDGVWRASYGGDSVIIPSQDWLEAVLVDNFADGLIRNWFPEARMVERHKIWELGDESTRIDQEGGVWTMTIDGEIIENGVLYNCVTRLLGICEANV